MIVQPMTARERLEGQLRAGGPRGALEEFLRECPVDDDDQLAELIDADGRDRIERGLPIELMAYLLAIPGLRRMPVSLDAAIDMTLRSLSGSGTPSAEAVETLAANYPDLERQIVAAAKLNLALWSTGQVRERRQGRRRDLPREFGPGLPGGGKQYLLLSLLGEGSWSDVFMGVDRSLSDAERQALVAIKVLADWSGDEWTRQAFADEATKARRIEHPGVVRVLQRGLTEEDEAYIVYEYVGGGDLTRLVEERGGPLAAREAASIVARIARGVQAAHTAGLVHCDLKPSNIVLTGEGEPKVTDFGIARRGGAGSTDPVGPDREVPAGTLAFMAPEQFRMDEGASDPPVDVYALGGILFWLLTARLPNGSTPAEIGETHASGGSRRGDVRMQLKRIDRDLAAVCARAMSPAPGERHFSPGELAEDLERWVRLEPIAWTGPSAARVARLWIRRRPAVASLGAVICAVSIAGGTVALHFRERAKADAAKAREAAIQIDAETRYQAEFLAVLSTVQSSAARKRGEGFMTRQLAMIWLMEFVYGPQVFGLYGNRAALWDDRIERAEWYIQQARRLGRADHFEARIWQTHLAFWLVDSGDFIRAEPVLADCAAFWRARLAPDDPWMGMIDSLRACVEIDHLGAEIGRGRIGPEQVYDAAWARAVLEANVEPMRTMNDPGPICLVALRRLRAVCGPRMLDDPPGWRAADEALRCWEQEAVKPAYGVEKYLSKIPPDQR